MWIFRSSHKHIGQDTHSEYLDGRLLGRPLESVEQQLADCDSCRQDLAELRALVAMMQQLPMAEPRRSFVMSAPPLEPVRSRPALALRAPNWVYAGAASVAALALAVTISVDATGGLTSDPLRQDSVTTAAAPVAELEEVTGATGPYPVPVPRPSPRSNPPLSPLPHPVAAPAMHPAPPQDNWRRRRWPPPPPRRPPPRNWSKKNKLAVRRPCRHSGRMRPPCRCQLRRQS